jgi:hypothetical protein
MSSENIFSALAKYNSAVDENYLTESFVFVVNTLLHQEHSIGIEILNKLCGNNSECSFEIDEDVSVSTQEVTEQGTPDIRVFTPNKLIYIEVKHDSPVDPEQLKRYKKDLESSSATIKRLILLTKFLADFDEHEGIPDKHVRWSEVHDWLANVKPQDSVAAYLIKQFKSFLEVKGMSIEKVGWEYINGVPALFNLLKMIEEVLQRESLRPNARGIAREYTGFYSGDAEFWCGISHDEPVVLLFELQNRAKFDFQALKTSSSYPVRENISNKICFCLSLESIHFFSLDKDKQLEEITKFVKTAYKEAQQMRIKEK